MARPNDPNRSRGTNGGGERKTGKSSTSQPTIKQQRVAKRTAKLEAIRSQQAKSKRARRNTILAGGIGLVLLVTLVVVITNSGRGKTLTPVAPINGVRTFPGLATTHVVGSVNYPQTPPVGGAHSAVLLNCAKYAEPVPNENAVHSLEHGAAWITYDPAIISGDQLTKLRKIIPKTYVILSPYQGLPSPIVASAWGVQLQVSRVDDPRISEFIAKYRESKSAPEPGAPCTGGLDGPGKLS